MYICTSRDSPEDTKYPTAVLRGVQQCSSTVVRTCYEVYLSGTREGWPPVTAAEDLQAVPDIEEGALAL